ncbi:MAG: hypothetical protein Q9198_003090 [Flavoplaca austrocitrina]
MDDEELGKDLSDVIRRAYSDAASLALYGREGAEEEDQGDDDTWDYMFPGIRQSPSKDRYLQIIEEAYQRVATHREQLQPFDLDDPAVTLIFYCGDHGFERLGGGRFQDPYSKTVYQVGEEDLQMPCDNTQAITSPGRTESTGPLIKYSIILCNVLNPARLAGVAELVEQRSDLIEPGWHIDLFYYSLLSSVILHELFHLTSFATMLPEGTSNEDEVGTFGRCKDLAKDKGLKLAVQNIDNYVYYSLACALRESSWIDGILQPRPLADDEDEDEDMDGNEDEEIDEDEDTRMEESEEEGDDDDE